MEEQILAAESKRRRCVSLLRKRPVRSGEDWFVMERLPCLQLKMARAASLCVCKEGRKEGKTGHGDRETTGESLVSLMAEVKEVRSCGLSHCVKDGSHYTWVSAVQDIQENAGDKHTEEARLEGNKRKDCGKLCEDMYYPDWFEDTTEDDEEVTAMSGKCRRKSRRKKAEVDYSENINVKKENGRGNKTPVNIKELSKNGIENEREKLNPGEMSPITAMCNRILLGERVRVPTKRNFEEETGSCPLCDKEMVISLLENHAAACGL